MWLRVRWLLDQVIERSQYYYRPHQHLTIDEQMIAYLGRHVAVQFMKDKPHRWGFKNFILCDATTTYVLNFMIYKGKQYEEPALGTPLGVTMKLMDPYLHVGHIVVADNWFTTFKLVDDLYKHDTGYIGTVRRRRIQFPEHFFIKKNELTRGQKIIYQHTEKKSITATAWGDRNVVFLVSSVNNPLESTTVQRYVEGGTKEKVPAPKVVEDYQRYMRGVDRLDQQINSLRPGSKTNRWSVPIAWAIINIAIHNSYILHCMVSAAAKSKPLTNYKFRLKLSKQLIGNYNGRQRSSHRTSKPAARDHHLGRMSKRRQCHVCNNRSAKPTHKQTMYGCTTCNVSLCISCYDEHRNAE